MGYSRGAVCFLPPHTPQRGSNQWAAGPPLAKVQVSHVEVYGSPYCLVWVHGPNHNLSNLGMTGATKCYKDSAMGEHGQQNRPQEAIRFPYELGNAAIDSCKPGILTRPNSIWACCLHCW